MVKKLSQGFSKFFDRMDATKQKLIRSTGLIFLHEYFARSGLIAMISSGIKDKRHSGKVKYRIADLIIYILLNILDGNRRISQYRRNPNSVFFKEMLSGNEPHPTVVLNALKANKFLKRMLDKILLMYAMNTLVGYCRNNKVYKVIIDMDQTGREIHGKQENVSGGYFANRAKSSRGFQIRLWSVRGLKIILKADLLAGSAHSQSNVNRDFRLLMKVLKKAGIKGIFVGDSGFLSGETCSRIEESGHQFLFAQPQRKNVRKRGKNAKHKRSMSNGQVILKEGKQPVTGKFRHVFREIYIRVLSPDGQLWFDFASDKFTNVLLTNMPLTAENIYKLYRGHAVIETIIEELKNDFGTGIAHADLFSVNAAMTVCTALAYNVKNGFLDFHGIRLRDQQKMKLSTFQALWVHIPAILTKNGNRRILKLPPNMLHQFKTLKIAA